MRKNFLSRFAVLAVCALIFQVSVSFFQLSNVHAADTTPPKPNIIIIMADDMGVGDISSSKTPSLTTLAQSGVTLTNFYTPAPICAPSRAALMTGQHPSRIGFSVFPSQLDESYDLPQSATTLADIVKKADYDTAIVGKWHLGYDETAQPWNKGFAYSYWLPSGTGYNFAGFCMGERNNNAVSPATPATKWTYVNTHKGLYAENFDDYLYRDVVCKGVTAETTYDFFDTLGGRSAFRDLDVSGKIDNMKRSLTQILVDRAIDYIKNPDNKYNRNGKPFFLYLALTAPHTPLDIHLPGASATDLRNTLCKTDTFNKDRYKVAECQNKNETAYVNVINELDRQVGNLRACLDGTLDANNDGVKDCNDISQNTIIIFTSDNGPFLGRYLEWGDIHSSTRGLRGGKRYSYEAGVRLPFIAKWPAGNWGTLQGNKTSPELADMMDIFATLVHSAQSDAGLADGNDLTPVLEAPDKAASTKTIHSWWHDAWPYCGEKDYDIKHQDCAMYDYSDPNDPKFVGKLWKLTHPFAVRSSAYLPTPDCANAGVDLKNYKLYLNYKREPVELYDVEKNRAEDRIYNLVNNPDKVNIKQCLKSIADNERSKEPDSQGDRLMSHNFPAGSGWLCVKPDDQYPDNWLNMKFNFFQNSERRNDLDAHKLTTKGGMGCVHVSDASQGTIDLHIDKPATSEVITNVSPVQDRPPYQYYLPSIYDTNYLYNNWENFVTVQAKKPVQMDVKIKVYDLAGVKQGEYIRSNTDFSVVDLGTNNAIAPNSRVTIRPSQLVGTIANPLSVEGSIIVETSEPAIVSTNTIANDYKGFSINEAATPRSVHFFPKIYDGPNYYQNYLLIQNIYDTPRNVTIKLKGSTCNDVFFSAVIPKFGTLKKRPSEMGLCSGKDFNGTAEVYSNAPPNIEKIYNGDSIIGTDGFGMGLPIPAMCRYEAGTNALAIYESTVAQSSLYFPVLKDGKFGGSLDYQNFLSVANPGNTDATVSIYLYKNKSDSDKIEDGKLLNEVIPAGGKKTWRPSWIKGTLAVPADFEGSAVVLSNVPVVGQTNTIYPDGYGSIKAFDLFESAIPSSTLYFPKAFDNLCNDLNKTPDICEYGEHLFNNNVYIQNPDGVVKNIRIEQFNNDGTPNGSTQVTVAAHATHVFRPKDLVTDGTGTFRGSVKITETSGKQITGAMKYEIYRGTTIYTVVDAIAIYRSMGQ